VSTGKVSRKKDRRYSHPQRSELGIIDLRTTQVIGIQPSNHCATGAPHIKWMNFLPRVTVFAWNSLNTRRIKQINKIELKFISTLAPIATKGRYVPARWGVGRCLIETGVNNFTVMATTYSLIWCDSNIAVQDGEERLSV
jgi:hypothetical protein